MAERTWTTEQRQCIEARGGTLLVSAAAGSGKTAVLVERILHRILGTEDGTPVDIDRLLVVTFTRAAAAEMKQRLFEALTRAAATDPSPHIRRQLLRLPFAQIGTIDSFCSWLVREHAASLGISPNFKVMDAAPAELLWQAALMEELEQRYAAHEPAFIRLADSLSDGRDDQPLIGAAHALNVFAVAAVPRGMDGAAARRISRSCAYGTDGVGTVTAAVRVRRLPDGAAAM